MVDVSESIGFGLWQAPVVLLTFYRGVPSAMLMMMINFAAPKTSFWCRNDTFGKDDISDINHSAGNLKSGSSECFILVTNDSMKCDSWVYDHSTFTRTLVEEVSRSRGILRSDQFLFKELFSRFF